VDDLFAPPGNDWQPVSPKLRTQRRIMLAGGVLLGAAVTVAGLVYFGAPRWSLLALLVVGVVVLVWGWWLIGRNVSSWGYAERDEDLYIKHGVISRQLVTVPYGRMQYVDVHAGPLDQLFEIANVHLHTASPGTSAIVPGLPAAEAARLRDRLTSLGESQAAGL
jgi:membrane protein YdbS with pleckstrin-like domain